MNDYAFPVSLSLRLDWSELDLYGHINNVAYFKYLQASRVNYWEQIGMDSLDGQGMGPVLAATQCDFRQPLHYPGSITIRASITEMRHTSFSIYHHILNSDGQLAAEGRDVVVLYDYRKSAKSAIPEDMRRLVESLEGRTFPAM